MYAIAPRGIVSRLLMVSVLLLGLAATARAQEGTERVTVEGFEAIVGENQMVARDKALEQALRTAVEQVAGTVVSSETLVENFQLVNDRIYSKAKGFVQSYKILSEGAPGDGTYKVVAEVLVARKLLEDSLRDLVETTMQVTNKPRTLFMIAEQQIGAEIWQAWWTTLEGGSVSAHAQSFDLNTVENIFQQEFTDNGFPVVDLAAASGSIKVSGAYGMTDLSDQQVRELGNQMAAEMVVYGKAYARQGQQILNSPMYSISATASVRVVRTDTGRVITSSNKTVTIPHSIPEVGGTEALRRVAKDVAEELMPKMITTIAQDRSVELRIAYGNYRDLVKFKQALKSELRGVQAIHQRQTGGGKSTLELDLKSGTAQGLADEMAIRDFKGFLVEIQEVTQNTIRVNLVSR